MNNLIKVKPILLLVLLAASICFYGCTQARKTSMPVQSPTPDENEIPVQTEPSTAQQQPQSEPASENEEGQVIRMSFVGDCLLGSDFGKCVSGSYNWYARSNDPSYFFSCVLPIFSADDITVADCETVLTDRELSPIEKEENPGYWYYGPASNAAAFKQGSVEIASVANNHTGDYGREGYQDTIQALEDHGVIAGIDMHPIYYEVRGITVGILCCNCWSTYHASLILQTIEQMNACSDIQVIVPHGGTMNVYVPDEWRIEAYRSFIDAGAEIVAAGHPHRLQPVEGYHGGVIAYSLGNFCYGGSTLPENATVILSVSLEIKDEKYQSLSYHVIPCYLYTTPRNNYKPEPIDRLNDPAYNKIATFMMGARQSPL